MPTTREYTISELADLAGTTPRTVRYYIALGLLPPPQQQGPGAHYGEGHLARLRLIRSLQREHQPLAEIRSRLAGLDDAQVERLLEDEVGPRPSGSAIDYIRSVLYGSEEPTTGSPEHDRGTTSKVAMRASVARPSLGRPDMAVSSLNDTSASYERSHASTAPDQAATAPADAAATPRADGSPAPGTATTRSQWERVALSPDVELHVRRPLSRLANKRVERLISIARELIEEDQP